MPVKKALWTPRLRPFYQTRRIFSFSVENYPGLVLLIVKRLSSLQQTSDRSENVSEQQTLSREELRNGLTKIRTRRWVLWVTILIYVPGLLVTLYMGASGSTMTKLFGVWLALLCFAVGWATVAKCPHCGNNFHTNGPTFLPVRKCVHCGLHVTADKRS